MRFRPLPRDVAKKTQLSGIYVVCVCENVFLVCVYVNVLRVQANVFYYFRYGMRKHGEF